VIYRLLATHLAHKARFRCKEAATGAVTLVQRFGSALNLNIHLHMLCLDGVYPPRPDGGLRFTRVKAPEREELEHLVQQIAARVGKALERMGLGRGRGKGRSSAQPERSAIERHAAMRWAQRLKRVFGIDVESCVRCGKVVRVAAPAHPCARGISASLHVIASIEEPALIERILAHVRGKAGSDTAARGPPSTGPPVSA
jgi:hypothetical protein